VGHPAEKRERATYADLQAVPSHKGAELIRGTLHVMPRPAPRHARAASALGAKLGNRARAAPAVRSDRARPRGAVGLKKAAESLRIPLLTSKNAPPTPPDPLGP